jgi:phage pi2 protein 07
MRESYDIFTVCRKEERYKVKCFDFWKHVIPDTILTIKWAIKNFLAIRQAMPDFRRHVHANSQAVLYLPGSDAERWKSLYHE